MKALPCVGIILLIFFGFVTGTSAWFQGELELFDLVEEVNENFYTVMQVNPVRICRQFFIFENVLSVRL